MYSILILWMVFLCYLAPLIFFGLVVLRATTEIKRVELLIPTGSILGISFFVFLTNFISFLIPGKAAAIIAYLLLISIACLFVQFTKHLWVIDFPKKKSLFFCLLAYFLWLILVVWKGNHALIGSDVNLYYSIAHTLLRGNFPPQTPWQPDVPLSYHIGSSYLLGSFHSFTGLSFEFLHLIFAVIFIFSSSQIIIWILKRHDNLPSFLCGNLVAIIVLISFGFLKIAIPQAPFRFPQISSFRDFFLWIRSLPSVNQSIEVYGAPVNLDAMFYFIFHAFGFALMLTLITIMIYPLTRKFLVTLTILLLGISSLALINEAVFVTAAPSLVFFNLLFHRRSFLSNIRAIIGLLIVSILTISFQGGMVTSYILQKDKLEKSVLFFPQKKDLKEDAISYHYYQSISKVLPRDDRWLPFLWFHIGVDSLTVLSAILLIIGKFGLRQKIFSLTLFTSGILSLGAYYFIVPKFLIANGNRFLIFSYMYLSLLIVYGLSFVVMSMKNIVLRNLLIFFFLFFIFLPSVLPPFTLLSKYRFGENKLIPAHEQLSEATLWIKNNLSFNTKVMVLDARSPHPSGLSKLMVQAGVFTPVFPGNFRSYTIEASPEYVDIAYFLDPVALEQLKVDVILIDSTFFETLPDLRKRQVTDNKYFKTLFLKEYPDKTYERVLRIESTYLEQAGELDGTIRQLTQLITEGKIYIDNEENFNPSFLRRPLIFSLRGRSLYFMPQSGVYLNVEVDIPFKQTEEDLNYDYLLLGKNTSPKAVCNCEVKAIWQGLKGEVIAWKKTIISPGISN